MSPLTLLNVQAAVVILGPLALGWWLRSAVSPCPGGPGDGERSRSSCRCWRGASFLYILAFLLTPLVRIVCRLTGGVLDQSPGPLTDGGPLRGDGTVADAPAFSPPPPAVGAMRSCFGAGHGGIEAILLVGGSTIWGIVLLQLGDNLMAPNSERAGTGHNGSPTRRALCFAVVGFRAGGMGACCRRDLSYWRGGLW